MSNMSKLLSIQSRLVCQKNQKNNFGNYKYRSCEDILEAVKPLLTQERLQLTISDEIVEVANRVYVKATATLKDDNNIIETSTGFAREEEIKKGMDCSQITGACSSYARKYALNGLFLIDDNKDSDTTNTHDKEDNKHANFKDDSFDAKITKASNEDLTEMQKEANQKTLKEFLDNMLLVNCKDGYDNLCKKYNAFYKRMKEWNHAIAKEMLTAFEDKDRELKSKYVKGE